MFQQRNKEVLFSVDIKTNGPHCASNDMLEIGISVYVPDWEAKTITEVDTKEIYIKDGMDNRTPEATTQKWLEDQGIPAKRKLLEDTMVEPKEGIQQFIDFIEAITTKYKAKPCLVAFPSAYDTAWLCQYAIQYTGKYLPSFFACYDVKSYTSAALNCGWRDIQQKAPACHYTLFVDPSTPHTHNGLDDAMEQGRAFCNVFAFNNGWEPPFHNTVPETIWKAKQYSLTKLNEELEQLGKASLVYTPPPPKKR